MKDPLASALAVAFVTCAVVVLHLGDAPGEPLLPRVASGLLPLLAWAWFLRVRSFAPLSADARRLKDREIAVAVALLLLSGGMVAAFLVRTADGIAAWFVGGMGLAVVGHVLVAARRGWSAPRG